ncbi:hypothetical protein M404DRAFT_24577 [Pisolithus tinctorius Marx 270]|uniref:Uncharacterized protein n=1 Tax=Pisolithus tinctorius Marx 270 TaxID=870435 RepID=A0A0C3PEL4_PISTI|nr:hypothetical protein M404DRAFT_24577 [Pisolithus tinctorius Marx 270]
MITSYHLFIADPTIVGTIYHEVDENSPLDLVYHTTIQALWLEELSHYVNRQNPLLSPAHTILNEIAREQVPLLLQLFDILGGADLIYSVHQYPTLITPPPPGLYSQPCESHNSPSEVDPETTFGISRAELDYTPNVIKTLAQLPPSPMLNALAEADCPLTPSNPHYRQVCYVCHCLGHIHINCGLYECPLFHATRPGHTQAQCCSICPCHPLQERITTPSVVDDHTLVKSEDNDLYNDDFDFNDSAISNMTREPYRE